MWIAGTNIRLKKIIVLLLIAGFLSYFSHNWIAVFPVVFFLLYKALKNGIYIKKETFLDDNKNFEIRYYFPITKPLDSYLELYCSTSVSIYSRIYLYKQNDWAYFDLIRKVLINWPQKNILIAGGGLGSLALTINQNFNFRKIDVLELSPILIQKTKKCFPHLFSNKKISIINVDAYDYILKQKKRYDFIFLDIFQGNLIPLEFKKVKFIKKLKRSTDLLIVNFGFKQSNIHEFTKEYFLIGSLNLYLWNKNLVGINKQINHAIPNLKRII